MVATLPYAGDVRLGAREIFEGDNVIKFGRNVLAFASAALVMLTPTTFTATAEPVPGQAAASDSGSTARLQDEGLKNHAIPDYCLDGNATYLYWTCNGSDVQKWSLIADEDEDGHRLRMKASGECIKDNGPDNTAEMVECRYATIWKVTDDGSRGMEFRNDENGRCITIWRSLRTQKCDRSAKQRWIPVS